MDWDAFSLVIRGTMRTRVLLTLDRPMTPSELRKALKASYSHLSDVLRLLRSHKLVVCLTEEAVVGRLYQRTEMGEAVAAELRLRQDSQDPEKSRTSKVPEDRLNNP